MRAKVITEFRDKNTKKLRPAGLIFELSKERFNEIVRAGESYGLTLIEEYEPPKSTAKEEAEPAEEEAEAEEMKEEKTTAKKSSSKKSKK